MNSKKIQLRELLASDKARTALIIVGLVAIVLIFLSSQFSASESSQSDALSMEDYQENLSTQVLNMVESVEGAGEARILLTLENSYEYIYLDDGKTLQKINEPTVRGVVVACQGADSAVVRADITELLTTVLNIPSTKVCISKLN